jgi:hypothetical protein
MKRVEWQLCGQTWPFSLARAVPKVATFLKPAGQIRNGDVYSDNEGAASSNVGMSKKQRSSTN